MHPVNRCYTKQKNLLDKLLINSYLIKNVLEQLHPLDNHHLPANP